MLDNSDHPDAMNPLVATSVPCVHATAELSDQPASSVCAHSDPSSTGSVVFIDSTSDSPGSPLDTSPSVVAPSVSTVSSSPSSIAVTLSVSPSISLAVPLSVSNSSSVSLASLHPSVTVSWLAVSSSDWVADTVVSASVSPDVLVAISVAVSVAPSVSPSVSAVSSSPPSITVTLSISSSVSLTVPLSVSNSSSVSLASLHPSVTVSWLA